MARTMAQDELNILRKYFYEMEIPQEAKEERLALAVQLFFALSNIFDLLTFEPDLDRDLVRDFAISEWEQTIGYSGLGDKPFYKSRTEQCIDEVLKTTYSYWDSIYTFSNTRKIKIAETETNILFNHRDFERAKEEGKTMKTWVTMKDERVRISHFLTDEVTIPIDDLFEVGNSLLAYPGDTSHGASASEIVGCRCTLKYW